MDATHSLALETESLVSWTKLVVTGVVAALGYFIVQLVQRRRFYKDMVCSDVHYAVKPTIFPSFLNECPPDMILQPANHPSPDHPTPSFGAI